MPGPREDLRPRPGLGAHSEAPPPNRERGAGRFGVVETRRGNTDEHPPGRPEPPKTSSLLPLGEVKDRDQQFIDSFGGRGIRRRRSERFFRADVVCVHRDSGVDV